MMVFSVCVNDTVYLLNILKSKSCLWWALVHQVTFSSPAAFGGYQCITKIQNRCQYFDRLHINIISVNEITVFKYTFKLQP